MSGRSLIVRNRRVAGREQEDVRRSGQVRSVDSPLVGEIAGLDVVLEKARLKQSTCRILNERIGIH